MKNEHKSIIQTLREPRIFGMAIFDWVMSLLGAFIIGHFLLKLRKWNYWVAWIIFWIGLGIFTHAVFRVNTMQGYYLGLNPKPKDAIGCTHIFCK